MPRNFCAKNKQEVSVVFLKHHPYNSLKLQIRHSFLAYKEYKYKLNLHPHMSISIKLNQVFFFELNFLPWEFLLIKKLEIKKTKTTKYTTFKTDLIKVVLVFSISNFFTNKNSQGRKLSAVQLQEFSFSTCSMVLLKDKFCICSLWGDLKRKPPILP